MSAPHYIDTAPELDAFVSSVRRTGESRLAVDTEAASFHRYRDGIYLLQISRPTETALIDLDDLSGRQDLFLMRLRLAGGGRSLDVVRKGKPVARMDTLLGTLLDAFNGE